MTIPLDDRAPGLARHTLDGLAGWVAKGDLQRFQLAVSEMVTNAIVHNAGHPDPDDVRLVLRIKPDRLSASVIQSGQGFEEDIREPRPEQESGWGLYLVDQVADRWGVDGDRGTRVWAEFVLNGEDGSSERSSTTRGFRRAS